MPVCANRTHTPGLGMDEQAGPGVFFNNNNNSGLPGAGKGPHQPCDVGGGEAARAHYNIPGILHFLQHEWARFEVDRAQWEVERAELQVNHVKMSRLCLVGVYGVESALGRLTFVSGSLLARYGLLWRELLELRSY